MGNLRSPLGAVSLFFLIVVPMGLSWYAASPTLRMLKNRKPGARGFRYFLDPGSFLEKERYEPAGLKDRAEAIRVRTWIWVSVGFGLVLLLLS